MSLMSTLPLPRMREPIHLPSRSPTTALTKLAGSRSTVQKMSARYRELDADDLELIDFARQIVDANTGRADHQDILRQHLLAQLLVELQPPPAVAQRDCDRALGVALADDEAVQLGDDLAGGKVGHSAVMWSLRQATATVLRSATF